MAENALRTEIVVTHSGAYTVHIDGDDPCKPFAVFVHGGPGFNCHGERRLLGGRFRAEVNFLWFDLLGCGDFQPASDAMYSWNRQVEDAARVIRHFTPEPVHLIGHSLGAAVIHDLVRLDRALARSALWFAPTLSLAAGLRRALQRSLQDGRLDAEGLTLEEQADLDRFLNSPGRALGARDAAIILRAATASRDFFELYWVDRSAITRWAAWSAELPFCAKAYLDLTTQFFERGDLPLPDYSGIPVHLLHSHADPVAPWQEHARRLIDGIPHATATAIAGTGHWIHFERTEECVRETREFLARN